MKVTFHCLDLWRWRARALISAQVSVVLPAIEGMPQSQKHWLCNSAPYNRLSKTILQQNKGLFSPIASLLKWSSRCLESTFCVQRSFPYMPIQILPVNSLGLRVPGCILGTSRSLIPISMLNFAKTIYPQGCHSNI